MPKNRLEARINLAIATSSHFAYGTQTNAAVARMM